jgi:hypothetical protein
MVCMYKFVFSARAHIIVTIIAIIVVLVLDLDILIESDKLVI